MILTNAANPNRSLISGGGGIYSGTDKKMETQHYINRPDLHMTANTVTQ